MRKFRNTKTNLVMLFIRLIKKKTDKKHRQISFYLGAPCGEKSLYTKGF